MLLRNISYLEAYQNATFLYHEVLFDFEKAFTLNQAWLRKHQERSAELYFSEKHFTTTRFAEAERRITTLLRDRGLVSQERIPLAALQIATSLALNKPNTIREKIESIRKILSEQSEDFKLGWTFEETKQFIRKNDNLAPYRAWLLTLFEGLSGKNRNEILSVLKNVGENFQVKTNKILP